MAKHKTQKDETVESVADSYGVSASDLRRWNNMSDTDTLEEGQELNTSLKDWADETRLRTAQHIVGHPGMSTDMENLYKQIKNRKDFKYDLDADALYQQYKNKYINQGRLAMEDTMGQAAAMTGGYGNSYAQSVGQQAYNAQLDKLNDVIPDLYELAYNRYAKEGEDLYNKYSLAADEHDRQLQVEKDKLSVANSLLSEEKAKEEARREEVAAIETELEGMIADGATRTQVMDVLRAMKDDGLIDVAEFNNLKSIYAPAGQQY